MNESRNWVDCTIGEISKLSGGSAFKEKFQGHTSGEIPFIKVSDFNLSENQKYITRANNWISSETLKEMGAKVFPPGSVVFPKVGAALLSNRRRILLRPTALDNNLMAAIPNGCCSEYLYHALCKVDFSRFVQEGAVPSINQEQVASVELSIPPLPEQKKIAEILSGIDRVIASQQNRVRASLLLRKSLVTRHIENIEHDIDEAKLGDLLYSIDSGWSPDCLKRPPLSDSEWSILKTTSVTWKGFDQQERKALPSNLSPKEELVVEVGDILITRAGPAERTGVVAYADKKAVNTMISDKIIRLRCDRSTIEPLFLSIFLGTDYAQRQMLKGKVGMASSQTNISQQHLKDMVIRFPPLSEQRRISEIVTELQKAINQIQNYIEQTEKLKTSLSADLLSGRKRVSI